MFSYSPHEARGMMATRARAAIILIMLATWGTERRRGSAEREPGARVIFCRVSQSQASKAMHVNGSHTKAIRTMICFNGH